METMVQNLLVSRSALSEATIVDAATPALAEGEALLRVDAFSLTANNVTYAVFGEMMQYWNFFPAPEGFGRVPVWGFATVTESRHPEVAVGEKVYGYLPMSDAFKVAPGGVRRSGFSDTTPYRQELAPVYNSYTFTKADPLYSTDTEALQMLFRPLFMTSYLIDDFLADIDFFGAKQVIFSSASAKTAYATAQLLSARGSVGVVGLTSPGNLAFVKDLGCYGTAVAYDAIGTLDPSVPSLFVDIAGDAAVRSAVHHHFREALTYSLTVGATHWTQMAREGGALPGPQPQFFFAPTLVEKRTADWGAAGFGQKIAAAWKAFLPAAATTKLVQGHSLEDAARVFADLVSGRVKADEGHVIVLNP
jgi:hypothetical protein